MTAPLPPSPRGPDCPPAAVLEALSAGEPTPDATRAHVKACATCGAQLDALTAGRDAFLRARPPERFLRQLETREAAAARAPSPWRRLFPVLAAVVPLLVLVLVLGPRLLPDDPGVTWKGEAFRVVAARAGAEPVPLAQDGVVKAGDRLRFAYESPEAGHLLVLELDGRGNASVFHPFDGASSAPLAAAQRDFLPGSVELDDAPGAEWLFAVFSPRPLQAAPLLAQLREQSGRAAPTLACDGCRVSSLRLRKAP
ncbi:DUF4384 domain-containing protein [Pyxidicoccus xibeiensis]|uniref:DUF4384 domain-containing protein n=1 Tax=Pyxidicoccus xibeiensis TaxID=2906759 RepID=UPI0020A73C70|nr:DUF4384 domain-containing protein [Pyxidicoccus xibeiensis]MCP3141831.1 DUF4384 domain-containing protein [Pyxidicoccus xibeiensis]